MNFLAQKRLFLLGYGFAGSSFHKSILYHQLQFEKIFIRNIGSNSTTLFQSFTTLFDTDFSEDDILFYALPEHILFDVFTRVRKRCHTATTHIHFSGGMPLFDCSSAAVIHPPFSLSHDTAWPSHSQLTLASSESQLDSVLHFTLQSMNFKVQKRPQNYKLYHAGCIVAANFPYALFECAQKLWDDHSTQNAELFAQLARSAIEKIQADANWREHLTGPIARGDTARLQNYTSEMSLEIKTVYTAMLQFLQHAYNDVNS
jgi:predicted short-subunit dehydrogenase-like oxidoreductase (DUF2520 family)